MTNKEPQLDDFLKRPNAIAAVVAADDIFGVLTRSYDLHPDWAALVQSEQGKQEIIKAGMTLSADGMDEALLVRVTPLEIEIREKELASRDNFLCEALVRVTLVIPEDRADMTAFRDRILGSFRLATLDNLARHLEPEIRSGLQKACAANDAETLMSSSGSDLLAQAVTEGIQGPCFTSGLNLNDNVIVKLTCEGYARLQQKKERVTRRQREHEAERPLREALQKAQNEHMDHLASLLERARELTEGSPDAALHDLLKTFSEEERGKLYGALFRAEHGAHQTRLVAVAGGDEILFFDPHHGERPVKRLTIAGEAGMVRSIQLDRDSETPEFLLGASIGVYVLPHDAEQPTRTLVVPRAPQVRGGVNAVARSGSFVIATHSELGILQWQGENLDQFTAPFAARTADAKAVRGAFIADKLGYASIDDRIIAWELDATGDKTVFDFQGANATIASFQVVPDGVYAGTSDGRVLFWSQDAPRRPETIHRGVGRAVESIWLLETHGVRRLVFSDTSSRLHARVLGDSYACHYEAGGQMLRRVEIAPDLIVAVNDLRDRLICWSPDQGERPRHIIGVGASCQKHIQDVCLL
ncbi:MAG: WD40 repeat domain-containing protein [Planctomycetota bacterium]